MTEVVKCSHCGISQQMMEMAYIGPEDETSTKCHPFQEFVYLCEECYYENIQEKVPKKITRVPDHPMYVTCPRCGSLIPSKYARCNCCGVRLC